MALWLLAPLVTFFALWNATVWSIFRMCNVPLIFWGKSKLARPKVALLDGREWPWAHLLMLSGREDQKYCDILVRSGYIVKFFELQSWHFLNFQYLGTKWGWVNNFRRCLRNACAVALSWACWRSRDPWHPRWQSFWRTIDTVRSFWSWWDGFWVILSKLLLNVPLFDECWYLR